MPVFGGLPCRSQHVFDFADAVIREGGNRLVGAGVDADDAPVRHVVVVIGDGLEKLLIFAQHFRDVIDCGDMGGRASSGSCRSVCLVCSSGPAITLNSQDESLMRLVQQSPYQLSC